MPNALHIGTAGWSYKDWVGPFYPPGTSQGELLRFYTRKFRTVELDSSFYGTPAPHTVDTWAKTCPAGFLICPKVCREITHDKFLVDVDAELELFLGTMTRLGPALGPMLLQFPYYRKDAGVGLGEFVGRLRPFLGQWQRRAGPRHRLVVEVRNKHFWRPPLLDLLRAHGVALAVIDHAYMPAPHENFGRDELVTAPFTYLRLLGDRYGIERITKKWGRRVLDNSWRVDQWIQWIRAMLQRVSVFAFANNHYEGFAPATMERIGVAFSAGRGMDEGGETRH